MMTFDSEEELVKISSFYSNARYCTDKDSFRDQYTIKEESKDPLYFYFGN